MKMTPKLLDRLPIPLLNDLIAGQWLPLIGAGRSRNAVTPVNKKLPTWSELGAALGKELSEYDGTSTIDTISAYCHQYSRSKLIERLHQLLLIDEAQPSSSHEAFCAIPFDIVCTANFDFLLERQYSNGPRACRPILDEDQLGIPVPRHVASLLKIHGDLNHPNRMIVTEDDYDLFLTKYPLISTFVSNLLITRTAVLVGYSLDDPDLRQLWQIVSSRLGAMRKPAYCIKVNATTSDIARFGRRGVKVISVPAVGGNYDQTLAQLFNEINQYWKDNGIRPDEVFEEDPLTEMIVPRKSASRLCFCSVPRNLESFYREHIFPLVSEYGLVPTTASDLAGTGENIAARIESMILKSTIMLADIASAANIIEARIGLSQMGSERICIISEVGRAIPSDLRSVTQIERSANPFVEPEQLQRALRDFLGENASKVEAELEPEPRRLLNLREYRAASISALSLLEMRLRRELQLKDINLVSPSGISALIRQGVKSGLIDVDAQQNIQLWQKIRNETVHIGKNVTKAEATEMVNGVLALIASWIR